MQRQGFSHYLPIRRRQQEAVQQRRRQTSVPDSRKSSGVLRGLVLLDSGLLMAGHA